MSENETAWDGNDHPDQPTRRGALGDHDRHRPDDAVANGTRSSKAGWWILGIVIALITFGIGGCVIVVTSLADALGGNRESGSPYADEFVRYQEASNAISVSSCTLENGIPKAAGSVTNIRETTSSYFIQIDFFETLTGERLGSASVKILSIEPRDTKRWELSAYASGIEGAVRCERGFDSARLDD